MTMANDKVVIVGAGAMGVVTADHLKRAGAEVVFLVRPSRRETIPASYSLYSYDDGSLHELSGYSVISDPSELGGASPSFVILTLAGSSLVDDAGRALLASIGRVIRDAATILIVGSIGIGLREAAVEASGLPDDRVVGGSLAMLAHATKGVDLPLHPPTDPAKLAQADFAYRHVGETGFRLDDRNPAASARFVELYDRNGRAKCATASIEAFAQMTTDIFPVFVAAELAGWPNAEGLIADAELWPLAVDGVRAIRGLKAHGEAGRLGAERLTADELATGWRAVEKLALPLDFAAFNAYHHGQKIKDADVLLLKSVVAQGEKEGRSMRPVIELLHRLEAQSVG